MQIGMIGLGRMGANLVRRLLGQGHECVVYDVNPEVVRQLQSEAPSGRSPWTTSSPSWPRPGRPG